MSKGTIERTIDVPLAAAQVWARMTDVEEVASWLPILEKVTERAPLAAYDAVLQDRVGPFRLRADLAIEVTEATEPSVLAVQASGEDRQVRSRISVDASLRMAPGESGSGTRLRLVGSYEVTGRVATLGASTINAKARKLVDEFCTRVEAELPLMLPDVALHRPTTVDEAIGLLDWDNVGYAGGTELVPALRLGLRQPAALVDLKRVPELSGVQLGDGDEALSIGALTTHRQLATDDNARRLVPLLIEVAEHVGNVRVRSTGTVGGNLAFAEPRSDLATACIALDAAVEIAGSGGRRTITVDDLITGPYETVLEPDDLLVRLIVPARPRPGARYWKLQLMERPTLGVAIVPEGDDRATVVVGAATERPVRTVLPAGAEAAVDAVHEFCAGLDLVADLTGSAGYKRAVLVHHLLTELRGERAA